ncbi:SDR family NAD(P)-dependent oxidoreductase [Amorphus sp. 3PC139-8]
MPTVLITGGHGGIGYAAARRLASCYKWNILLAGRSPDQMKRAATDLRRDFGVDVTTLPLDTSSLRSVRQAAAELVARLESGHLASLDAVLCNAGGRFDGPVAYSEDGYELTFATNCLGHFHLLELVADKIADGGRIIFTASGTHDPDTMDGKLAGKVVEPDAIVLANAGKDGAAPISAGKRYSTSKLCNVLTAYELHRRLRRAGAGTASIAFDPGFIPDSGFIRGMPRPAQWLMKTSAARWLFKRIGVTMGSLEFSGAMLARLAADPAFANGSGKYFQCDSGEFEEARSSVLSFDTQRAAKLWNQMEALTHPQA